MFKKYILIVDGEFIDNKESLQGCTLIRKNGSSHVVLRAEEDSTGEIKVIFKIDGSKFVLSEKYYKNVNMIANEIKRGILNLIQEREIEYLYHFTNIKNLKSILDNGLLTLDNLALLEDFQINDELRLDNTSALCLSISFPNYKMFYRLRLDRPEEKWVVIAVDTRILYELDCGFFYTNAANHCFLDRGSDVYKSHLKLQELFTEIYPPNMLFGEVINRTALNINGNVPTDPQAEVLIFDNIDKKYIKGVLFNSDAHRSLYQEYNEKFILKTNKVAFNPRNDHSFW